MKLPGPEITNRYGLTFGRSRNTRTYATSGRRFRDYYTLVCLRCGWGFCPPRHKQHRVEHCDLVLLQLADDAGMRAFVRNNLFGTKPRRRVKR